MGNQEATNGPYHWGNGPKPKGWVTRLIEKLTTKKK